MRRIAGLVVLATMGLCLGVHAETNPDSVPRRKFPEVPAWKKRVEELRKIRYGPELPYDTTTRRRSPIALQAFEALKARTGAKWWIGKWSPLTGAAASIRVDAMDVREGKTTWPGSTLRSKAEDFLKENWKIFIPGNDSIVSSPDLRFSGERSWKAEFRQYAFGLPVYGSHFHIGFWYDQIESAGGQLFQVANVGTTPGIGEAEAQGLIREWLKDKISVAVIVNSSELVIFPSNPPRLMWEVQANAGSFLVNAATGEVWNTTLPAWYDAPPAGTKNETEPRQSPDRGPADDSSGSSLAPSEFFFTLTDSLDFAKTAFAR